MWEREAKERLGVTIISGIIKEGGLFVPIEFQVWGRVSRDDLQSNLIRSTSRAAHFANSKDTRRPPSPTIC